MWNDTDTDFDIETPHTMYGASENDGVYYAMRVKKSDVVNLNLGIAHHL